MKENVANFLLPRTAGWHRNGLSLFCMEIIAYKGRPFSAFVDEFIYYCCTATTLSCHFRNLELELNNDIKLNTTVNC